MCAGSSTHSLYLIKLLICISYPERNFRENQLLDGSISLSPLYSSLTNDLHVSTASSFHQSFLWLHPTQVKFTIFRVVTNELLLKPFIEESELAAAASLRICCLISISLRDRVSTPYHLLMCYTPWSVLQDGPIIVIFSRISIKDPSVSANCLCRRTSRASPRVFPPV